MLRALDLATSCRDSLGIARTTELVGKAMVYADEGGNARGYLAEAADRYRALNSKGRLAQVLVQLGTLGNLGTFDRPGDARDVEKATGYCNEALILYEELGNQFGVAWALNGLSCLAYKRHELEEAEALARRSLALRWEYHDFWDLPSTFEDLADIAGRSGRPLRAARLYGAAEALRETAEKPIPAFYRAEYDDEVAITRQQLGEAAFAAAKREGRAMTVAQAVTEARNEPIYLTSNQSENRPALTRRERQILDLMVARLSNQAIADAVFVSLPTVKRHVANVFLKLGVDSRASAVSYAFAHGLLQEGHEST